MELTSNKLKSIVCDPEGRVSMYGSEGDLEVMEEVLCELHDLEAENTRLRSALGEAVRYLKEAKAMFRPHTTNSDVDCFIEKWGK